MSRTPDVQKEREASKHRLLDVWSSLAERHTRRLDEDDIVDIRTGEITIDRGFIRKSRKVDFGAIAAPTAGDAIDNDDDEGTDEEEEDEDGDELDAFSDTIIKPVPPVTALDLADAEDLCAFLEAERKRKELCGSDVEVDYSTSDRNQESSESEDVEHEGVVDAASEDELDNWDIDESSVVYPVIKQEYSDVEIVEYPSSTSFQAESTERKEEYSDVEIVEGPSYTIPQAESTERRQETLRKNSRKRKRVSSEASFSDCLPCQEQPPTVYKIPDNKVVKSNSPQRSPSASRSQRPRPTGKSSISDSGSVSGNSSDNEKEYKRKPSRSHRNNSPFPYHYPYPHHHQSYLPSPHRMQHHHHHPPPPPEMFAPPIPDPRAQFIITQAMHQLASLVGSPWTPPHDSSFIPRTPSRRHQSRRADSIFNTPYHPHPYPYSYDPNLSLASLPPESPEPISSPEKLPRGPQKSSMTRARSRSRGRRVSFKTDDRGSDRADVYSSPSKPRPRREVESTTPSKGKGKARAETLDSESSSETPLSCGDRKSYSRGRTPGPKIGLPKGIKPGHESKRRLKGAM